MIPIALDTTTDFRPLFEHLLSSLRALEESVTADARTREEQLDQVRAESKQTQAEYTNLRNNEAQLRTVYEELKRTHLASAASAEQRLKLPWSTPAPSRLSSRGRTRALDRIEGERAEQESVSGHLQLQLQDVRAELLKAQTLEADWMVERQALRVRLEELRSTADAANRLNEVLQTDCRQLKSDLAELRSQVSEFEAVAAERRQLREERATLLSRIEALERSSPARQEQFEAERLQVQDQLSAALAELDAPRGSQAQSVSQRDQLLKEASQMRADLAGKEATLVAERQALLGQLTDAQDRVRELEGRAAQGWNASSERLELLQRMAALEQRWFAREASFAAERNAWRQQHLESAEPTLGATREATAWVG